MWTSTSAFMPGRSSPCSLAIRISTGNIVTFWVVCDCGSILRTLPSNGRFGYASTVIVARIPGWILPMSVSSTSVRTCTSLRSAIRSSTVPPETSRVAEAITWPRSTLFWMIVPVIGARTLVSSSWSRAVCSARSARTCCARALA